MSNPLDILQKYWGYAEFRPQQQEIISEVLNGKDVLALLSTGGGKSLCYQIPALCCPGLCLVISPLISLMKDQVDGLLAKGIPAAGLYSGQSWKEVDQLFQQALRDKFKLLYISPERLETRLFKEYLPALEINLIAVDEAHCISEWGHDFRPSYRRISLLRESLPGIPVLALTATATRVVQEDIADQLLFKHPAIFKGPLLRPGLALEVDTAHKKERLTHLVQGTEGSVIVYCRSRKSTLDLAEWLNQQGNTATAYHGGMPALERERRQMSWMQGDVQVMVSTNAFGMGIDKPDVRMVIHYEPPDSLESYAQEAGRAGRDGNPSRAVLLVDPRDIEFLRGLPIQRFPLETDIRETYRDLVHFLQIPSGSGEMEWHSFAIDEFVKRFNRHSITTLYALKALEQQDLLQYAEQINLAPSLQFTVNRQGLERVAEANPLLAPLIDALLRRYPGILHYPTRISEAWLSRLTRVDVATVEAQLIQMDRAALVDYSPSLNTPQLRLLQPRVRMEDLRINYQHHLIRKAAYEGRIEKMIAYLTQTSLCRSLFLNDYFGGEHAERCGVCDVCRSQQGLTGPLRAPASG
jgi:ATP-dependent DNA helicase RecQ